MPFTIQDILTLKDGRRRVWGFFELFPKWFINFLNKQNFLFVIMVKIVYN